MPIVLSGIGVEQTHTLREIEQELGRRVGPMRILSVTSSTVQLITVAAITSRIEQGGFAELWILRRGRKTDGTAVFPFNTADRQRVVEIYSSTAGTLKVDRDYAIAPVAGEEIELHLLEPEGELRKSVLRGLERCWFVDRVDIVPDAAAAERDLTLVHSWLTKPAQLLGLEYFADVTSAPDPVEWWRRWSMAGHQSVVGIDPYPYPLHVTALRPHSSWVNGADSTGPTDDEDTLQIDLGYAVCSAHKYAWENFADRLLPVARTGLKASQAQVENGWSRWKATIPRPPDRIQLPYSY